MRLIFGGMARDVRLERKATAVSPLVALGVRANGQKVRLVVKAMGGVGSDVCRGVLDSLSGCGLCRPDLPDRCPLTDASYRDHIRGEKPPPAAAGIRPYRCTVNMYLICMCWLPGVGTSKRGRHGQIVGRGAEKTATIDPMFRFIRGI
jgi:hypothetical protein